VDGAEDEKNSAIKAGLNRYSAMRQNDFDKIPGSPIAYWLPVKGVDAFSSLKLSDIGKTRRGLQTGDKERFIRNWFECDALEVEFSYLSRDEAIVSDKKWFMFNNGGDSRKWYGNLDLVVEWEGNGEKIKSFDGSIVPSESLYFEVAICWPRLSSGDIYFRFHPEGVIPGDLSPCFYSDNLALDLAYLNSKCASYFLRAINPTVTSPVGDVAKLPVPSLPDSQKDLVSENVSRLVGAYREDWDSNETSWGFRRLRVLRHDEVSLEESWSREASMASALIEAVKGLEFENNKIFIDAFGLEGEISPSVPDSEVSLARANRERDMQRLLSYIIGCMMGRYSLDEPELIYAHSGGSGFDSSRYRKFPADIDGIIPVTDESWFEDDAAERVREFVKVVWGVDTLVENMEWLADSLGRKSGESADEAIRRYLSTSFYKDHLQTYKKRPIYWLFSSGKQKAFECLVYLHRYNEGTLSRMRMEYVVPLQSRMQARIDQLSDDIAAANSSAQQKTLQKRKDKLTKQLEELRRFDEALRPYADRRISLDLDDGVKVNYGKFGNLLAEVKAITGGKED
jgi:hypothetical protein